MLLGCKEIVSDGYKTIFTFQLTNESCIINLDCNCLIRVNTPVKQQRSSDKMGRSLPSLLYDLSILPHIVRVQGLFSWAKKYQFAPKSSRKSMLEVLPRELL